MNCEKIQNTILTDYIDNEMNGSEKISIERHLAHCPNCKKFFMEAKKVASGLFAKVGRIEPPEYIWRRIKENIAAEQQKKPSLADIFFEKLKHVFYIPNPALALATVLTMILIFGTVTKLIINNQEFLRVTREEQAEYFEYIGQIPTDASQNNETGFGTSVEEYFL